MLSFTFPQILPNIFLPTNTSFLLPFLPLPLLPLLNMIHEITSESIFIKVGVGWTKTDELVH